MNLHLILKASSGYRALMHLTLSIIFHLRTHRLDSEFETSAWGTGLNTLRRSKDASSFRIAFSTKEKCLEISAEVKRPALFQ